MYTPAFYRKYLYDILINQHKLKGSVPYVVPDCLRHLDLRDTGQVKRHAACAWADAATVIPWTLYLFYGDISLLEEQYENMSRWVDYVHFIDEKYCDGRRLWEYGFHFADWLALDNPDEMSSFGGTDTYYVSSAYYFHSAELTAKAAGALGYKEDEKRYKRLASEIKAAIQKKYFPGGELTENTQTAMLLALAMGFVPEGVEEQLLQRLQQNLKEHDVHPTTGFVGTPLLCPVLSEYGLNDYAYTLLLNEDMPSWLYAVKMGATTIWERWNSIMPNGEIFDPAMNSLNHYAYGSIVVWIYRYVAGITPQIGAPGFQKVDIKPYVDPRMEWVDVSYSSIAGRYRSAWRVEQDCERFEITVPFNCEAYFKLPKLAEELSLNEGPFQKLNMKDALLLTAGDHTIVVRH